MPIRHDFNHEQMPQRQALLSSIASSLKLMSDTYNLSVVITNQVTPKRNDATGTICYPSICNHILILIPYHVVHRPYKSFRSRSWYGQLYDLSCLS
jgi:hypothetical protein